MALEGNLEDFELTDVFQLIQLGAKDGSLRIQTADDVGVVYFKTGKVVHARTNSGTGELAIDRIMTWKRGRFVFNPNEETIDRTVDLPIQQVILDAARRIDEYNKIQRLVPSFDVVVKIVEVPDAGVEKIDLRPEEWKVLAFIDGTMTIAQIAHKVNMSELEVSRILYGLVSTGLVEVIQRPTATPVQPAKPEPKGDDKKSGFFGMFKKKQ